MTTYEPARQAAKPAPANARSEARTYATCAQAASMVRAGAEPNPGRARGVASRVQGVARPHSGRGHHAGGRHDSPCGRSAAEVQAHRAWLSPGGGGNATRGRIQRTAG